MISFFDSSALVKRYIQEDGSQLVAKLLSGNKNVVSRLTEVEIYSAMMRRWRMGDISEDQRNEILSILENDFSRLFVVELNLLVCKLARCLLLKHALRTGDSLQLASCLWIKEKLGEKVQFVAFNTRLCEAAKLEGITVKK